MDFVLGACRVMHIIGSTVWVGGLIFLHAVLMPVVPPDQRLVPRVNERYVGFSWMCAWTIFITGLIMMLLDPRFLWFQYKDSWSALLGFKQLIFVLLVVYAFGYARMVKMLSRPQTNGGSEESTLLVLHRMNQFRVISILLGLTGLIFSVLMK